LEKNLTRSVPGQLETLAGFWLALRANGLLPWREDFTPRALKPWLGNLALLEPVAETDFRFRLSGTYLSQRFGSDATGKRLTDLSIPLQADLRDRLNRAMALHAPVLARVQVLAGNETVEFCDLILPLSSHNVPARLLLLAAYPFEQTTEIPGPISTTGRTWEHDRTAFT
jgi:hypothetical protein